ncbi:hypothetical protein HPULCUR_000616 [Helicostylum pulchrum]|uniref:Uncharacterized protein n=1 Tax=Helicostylum pulchrum TaxID=562976 RepID=A0ABP9XKE7_9FUNG
MNYSLLMEEEKLSQALDGIEDEAGAILVSMDNFNKLWNNIYESYKTNNLEIPKALDNLIISIYNDWKYKSNLIEKIEESFDKILEELKIAKKKKILNNTIMAEINQEVQKLSKFVEAFEIDKNAIDYLVKECKNTRPENISTKPMILWPLYNKRLGINTITGVASVLLIWNVFHTINNNDTGKYLIGRGFLGMVVVAMQYSYIRRKIKSWVLGRNLSKLSRSSIEMNTELKKFGISVSMETRRVQVDTSVSEEEEEIENFNAAFDIEIDSLIKIAQHLRYCFESIQHHTSQNESNARKLALKSDPSFLIEN